MQFSFIYYCDRQYRLSKCARLIIDLCRLSPSPNPKGDITGLAGASIVNDNNATMYLQPGGSFLYNGGVSLTLANAGIIRKLGLVQQQLQVSSCIMHLLLGTIIAEEFFAFHRNNTNSIYAFFDQVGDLIIEGGAIALQRGSSNTGKYEVAEDGRLTLGESPGSSHKMLNGSIASVSGILEANGTVTVSPGAVINVNGTILVRYEASLSLSLSLTHTHTPHKSELVLSCLPSFFLDFNKQWCFWPS